MGIYAGSDFSNIFRGISNAPSSLSKKNTPLSDESEKKAAKETNKSALTVALEDFTSLTKSYNSSGRSQVTSKDAKKSFSESIFGKKSDNVFKTSAMRSELKENSYTQSDIFAEDVAKNGGIKYSKDGDDIYKSALNYAKADIGAIEKSYKNSDIDASGGKKLKLNFAEIKSYSGNADAIKELDLDGDPKNISAEEYASYTVVADGLFSIKNGDIGFSSTSVDGKITSDEASLFEKARAEDIIKYAKQVYNDNYGKNK